MSLWLSFLGREVEETTAEIYMKIAHLPLKTTITDDQMWQLARHFKVTPRGAFLSGK